MADHGHSGWHWTERPEYSRQCEGLQNADHPIDIDAVKWVIEDNVLLDPLEGSRPAFPPGHPKHDPDQRRIIVEVAPAHGISESLVVVFRIGPMPNDVTQPRDVIGWEILTEASLRPTLEL